MSSEQADPQPAYPIVVLCPHCQDLMEVKDPASLILALHIANVCPELAVIVGSHDG